MVHQFEVVGASAIHIEDTGFGRHTDHPAVLLEPALMCQRIRACRDARNELLPCGRFNEGVERYRVLEQFQRRRD